MVVVTDDRMNPKVLVGMITSDRHRYCQEACIYCIKRLSYGNFEWVVAELSKGDDNYNLLKETYGEHIIRGDWFELANERTANGREQIRKIAVKGNFDYILYLDADWLIPVNTIERMMAHGKDCTGFLYNYGIGKMSYPSIAKSGFLDMKTPARGTLDRLDLYTWEEVYELLIPRLVKCYGAGIGLLSRKVFSVVPWRHCKEHGIGDDVQYWHETNDRGFEWWCDTSFKVKHLNISWSGIATFEGDRR